MREPYRFFAGCVLLAALWGCGESDPPTIPTEPPRAVEPPPEAEPALSSEVTPTVAEGSVDMTFLSAEPPPGTSLSGCGAQGVGCEGRIRMRIRIEPVENGHVVDASAYLYGTERRIACLIGRNITRGSFELRASEPRTLEIVFDRSDACPPPEKIRAMNLILSGDVAASSRRGWLIEYGLEP